MLKLFIYLGNAALPYRTIMKEHTDFTAGGFNIRKDSVVIAEQTHSDNVHICIQGDSGAGFDDHPQISDCDALITDIQNQILLIRTADCTPVLLYDVQNQAVGAIHSGREGTKKNIVGKTILTMTNAYCTKPENLQAWIGAGICKTHYPVGEIIGTDFLAECKNNGIDIKTFDISHPDIQCVLIEELLIAGLKKSNIKIDKTCTYESLNHYSYRRDGTHNRQVNLIGMYNGKYYL